MVDDRPVTLTVLALTDIDTEIGYMLFRGVRPDGATVTFQTSLRSGADLSEQLGAGGKVTATVPARAILVVHPERGDDGG